MLTNIVKIKEGSMKFTGICKHIFKSRFCNTVWWHIIHLQLKVKKQTVKRTITTKICYWIHNMKNINHDVNNIKEVGEVKV